MNPASGANTGYLNLSIGGSVTSNAGPVEVYRYRAFMLTLGATASVNAWYYPPLQNLPGRPGSTTPGAVSRPGIGGETRRRIARLPVP